MTGDNSDDEDPWNGRGRTEEEEEEEDSSLEYFILQESTGYMAPTLRCLAILHTVISFLCVVGYYYLKVHTYLPNELTDSAKTNTVRYIDKNIGPPIL